MPDRPDTIQITITEIPYCDWQLASRFVTCPDGKVVIEMAHFDTKRGELYLPDSITERLRPDIGTVIASGEDIRSEIEPGDVVIVRPYDGTIRIEFEAGDYKPDSEIRFYGTFIPEGKMGHPKECPWYDSILGKLQPDMQVIPTRNNVLVKRDPVLTEDRGIMLLADFEFRTNVGTVVAVGPGTYQNDGEFKGTKVKPGDRVVYHPIGMVNFDLTTIAGDSDLCIMPEDSIEAILPTDAVVTGIRQKELIPVL